MDEYVYYSGSWRKQNVGLVKNEPVPCAAIPGTSRYHVRLWGLESNLVVGAAHFDYNVWFEHKPVLYEEIEDAIADDLRLTDASP